MNPSVPVERSSLLCRWTSHTPDALFRARVVLRQAVKAYGGAGVVSDVVTAGAELLANAVEHACGPYELHLCRSSEELICAVVDHDLSISNLSACAKGLRTGGGSESEPRGDAVDDLGERGRGLGMVHRLSGGVWGIQLCGGTKVVWCSVPLE